MKLLTLAGRPMERSVNRYRIVWEKKSRSKIQFRVKQLLKVVWDTHIVFEEFPVFGTKMKVDFYNATKKVAIEVNGPQHDKFNKFFHDNSRLQFLKGIKRDTLKYQWLEKNGIFLIEIIEEDLKDLNHFYARIQTDGNTLSTG